MSQIHLKIITPKKVVLEEDIQSVSLPSADGEITILPHHANLLSLLAEGIVTIRNEKQENYLAIGGGYVETNGEGVNVLVSRAYGQDEIDHELTQKALENARNLLKDAKDESQRAEAIAVMRRSIVDLKLIRRHRRRQQST